MKCRTNLRPILRLFAASALLGLGGGLPSALPARADDFEQLRRARVIRAPQLPPAGDASHSPAAGDIVPIPGQPAGPPSPRPPQGWTPCATAPLAERGLAGNDWHGASPTLTSPRRTGFGWVWLSGWLRL